MAKSSRRNYRGKERLKKCVFRRFLKSVSDGADATFCGSVFHSFRELSGDRKSSIVSGRRTGASDDVVAHFQ